MADKETTKSRVEPSGLSYLFNNNDRPLNAYVVTSKPPLLYRKCSSSVLPDSSSSSPSTSAYYTASVSDSIDIQNWTDSPSSDHHLSRTISTNNYFDNQSDYEVILDDGSRQKRTISLSTVHAVPSVSIPQQLSSIPFFEKWLYTSSRDNKNRKNNRKPKETTRLLKNGQTHDDEQMPLSLSSSDSESSNEEDEYDGKHQQENYILQTLKKLHYFWNHNLVLNHQQKMVLKCSFAYMIGSLFTFIPTLNALCGTHVASHMAATVTVFFNPAKSVGGMVEAAGFGWLYTLTALTLSLASMYTTDYFIDIGLPNVASMVSLGFWLAGSTFAISYLKAKINTPSILTASGLAFIILFSVIVRQGSGNEAEFDFTIITETFGIVAIGTLISVTVCVLIWPMSASQKLQSNIDASLLSTRVLLKLLTKTFLLDADLPEFTANQVLETALKSHRTSFTSLKPALKAAKLEFYNLEMRHHAKGYSRVVESIERLAQHVGGLKSSCGLQVEVMQQMDNKKNYGAIPSPSLNHINSRETYNVKAGPQRKKMESELKREKEDAELQHPTSYFDVISNNEPSFGESKKSKEGALVQFIRTVRPPMKSLAYTCKQTIIHLQAQFTGKITHTTPSFRLMRQNLASAIQLFESSQHQALLKYYQRRFKRREMTDNVHLIFQQEQGGAEDVFLIYFFVFCMLEFAKELMTLVESVESVFDNNEIDVSTSVTAWIKYFFSRRSSTHTTDANQDIFIPNNHNTLNTLHTPAPKTKVRKVLLRIWAFLSEFRTYRIRFAIKSTLIAMLISVLAFVPTTRPYFTAFKMEWTLITVMAVMMPTVGGTNVGAVLRVIATILGCVVAVIVFTLFRDNTFMLWLLTWLISVPSFWMILNHKHGRFGLFTLLAYNLVVLYKFNHPDDDSIHVVELAWKRCVAVSLGVIIGLIVTAYLWPYEARTEVRKGLSDLLLRLSWLYKQLVSIHAEDEGHVLDNNDIFHDQIERLYHPLDLTIEQQQQARAAGLQKIELSIQLSIFTLQGLLVHAPNEPRLKGPFPAKTYTAMINCCQNILDKFLSLRIIILKDVWASFVRRNFLLPASQEFMEMSGNVFLYFYILASALQLKTPLPPYLPPAEKTRQTLMKRLQQLPLVMEESIYLSGEKKDECYMAYYAYVVLMENIIRELDILGDHMKDLFGSLVPQDQWLKCFGRDIESNA